MTFISTAAPLGAYRAGRLDEAAALASRVIAADPNAGDAHLCLALIGLRRGDQNGAMQALRNCARVRSADWILWQIRADLGAHGAPGLPSAFAFRLGAWLRSQLTSLSAPLAPEHRRAGHPFVNVVGTSWARSFGGSTALFPLFIGMGPTMLLLTEEAAAVTRRKFALNLERVDTGRDTLLILGGDPYYYIRNILKTRREQADHATDEDFATMALVAQRHAGLLADARKLLTGKIYLLGCTPSFWELVDQMALRLNAELKPVCDQHGVELLDFWSDLADPVTNRLRAEYSANAYSGDTHFSMATTPIFIEALKARGSLPAETPTSADFEWTSVFECDVDKAERTRIWCEPSVTPNNAFKSDKIASSHLGGRIADLITFMAAYGSDRTLAMVNVRDGFLPGAIPQAAISGCLATTDTRANLEAAQMTLDFFGRSDVTLYEYGEAVLEAMSVTRPWGLLLLIHPDTAAEDERRCNEVLARIGGCQIVFVGTAFPDRIGALSLGQRSVRNTLNLSNKHIPAKWADYTLFIAS